MDTLGDAFSHDPPQRVRPSRYDAAPIAARSALRQPLLRARPAHNSSFKIAVRHCLETWLAASKLLSSKKLRMCGMRVSWLKTESMSAAASAIAWLRGEDDSDVLAADDDRVEPLRGSAALCSSGDCVGFCG
eukprot:m.73561 g.73561  ORF g.73561 m.73561 type:complete len:132 (-) comp14467_c0_seq1:93-488(-)